MRKTRWLVALLIAITAAVALRFTVLTPDDVVVRTVRVDRGVVEETITNTRAGTVKVRRRASLSPQMGGLVVALPHREGSWVEAGDLLLKLDDRAQRAELEMAKRDVRSARARSDEARLAADLAEKELARVRALHGRGFASEQNLDVLSTERDRSLAACAAAVAAVDLSNARVAAVQVQLDFTEVRAPFAGTVAELTTEVGEWITPAPPGVPIPPVVDLLDPGSLYVSAPIDEVDAERVQVGQPARVTVDSRPADSYTARVARVAPYVLDDLEQNRTVEVEVEFESNAETVGILPGTSADVEVILDRREDALRVPSSGVAEEGTVLVVEDGVLVERTVRIGLENWQLAEVISGIEEGEEVVTSRLSTDVRAGAKVRQE
jgi:HlyD family secretion protein